MTSEKSRTNEEIQASVPAADLANLNEDTLEQEAIIVQQVSQGDQDALITLYENHIDRVYQYFYSKVGNVTEAEDLTSKTFTQAIDALMDGQYAWQGKPIGAWLFTIANNVLQERNQNLNNLLYIENIDNLLEPIQPITQETIVPKAAIQRDGQAILWELVKKLPLVEQQILIMRHVYSLPYSEIARRIKRGEHATKQLQYRALTKLKRMIQNIDQ
jgi:RNA polymerase sigma-70 factor (ECF subfamily)